MPRLPERGASPQVDKRQLVSRWPRFSTDSRSQGSRGRLYATRARKNARRRYPTGRRERFPSATPSRRGIAGLQQEAGEINRAAIRQISLSGPAISQILEGAVIFLANQAQPDLA